MRDISPTGERAREAATLHVRFRNEHPARETNEPAAPEPSASSASAHQRFAVDVDFEAPPGVTILFGPSGAGKSTILAVVAGLLRPREGRVTLGDEVWLDTAAGVERPVHRRRVAFVFQSLALFPHLTAAKNVAYGMERALSAREGARLGVGDGGCPEALEQLEGC